MNILSLIFSAIMGMGFPSGIDGQMIVPFQAPDHSDHRIAVEGKLKASLRFGYIKDNPEAESLRERREYNHKGFPIMIYKFSNAGQVEQKEDYTYDPGGTRILFASVEHFSPTMDQTEFRTYRFDLEGRLLEYKRESIEDGFSGIGNTYDPSGRLLIVQHFEKDRLPGSSDTYGYNAAGKCTLMTRRDIAGDIELLVKYELDSKGRALQEAHFIKGTALIYTIHNTYDSQGKLSRMEKVGRSGDVGAWETYKYDTKGHLIEKHTLDQGETKPMVERYKLDSKGRLVEQKVYDNDGSLFQWFKYSHDSTGTGAGLRRMHSDGSLSMESITRYDEKGRKTVHWTTYVDGSGSMKIEYRYDNAGLPMEEKHTETGQEQATYWFVHERY